MFGRAAGSDCEVKVTGEREEIIKVLSVDAISNFPIVTRVQEGRSIGLSSRSVGRTVGRPEKECAAQLRFL